MQNNADPISYNSRGLRHYRRLDDMLKKKSMFHTKKVQKKNYIEVHLHNKNRCSTADFP